MFSPPEKEPPRAPAISPKVLNVKTSFQLGAQPLPYQGQDRKEYTERERERAGKAKHLDDISDLEEEVSVSRYLISFMLTSLSLPSSALSILMVTSEKVNMYMSNHPC